MARFRVRIGAKGAPRVVEGSKLLRLLAKARAPVTVTRAAGELAGVRALRIARRELGTTEQPAQSNRGKRVEQYQAATTVPGTGWPYCMAFVVWLCKQADIPIAYQGAYVPDFERWARRNGRFQVMRPTRSQLAEFLWAVVFNFDEDDEPEHVGVLERVTFHGLECIEANTTAEGVQGSQANGGGVHRRYRQPALIKGYVRLGGLQ